MDKKPDISDWLVEPTEANLAELQAESHVIDAEVLAVDAESRLLSAIDRLAEARAMAWLLRIDAVEGVA